MKYFTQLLCGVVLSSTLISAAISAEATVASSIEGTVVSSLNTDSYTYVEISKDDQKSWIVGPLVAVKPGNQVKFEQGAIMAGFYSKQLNRTFPTVMFVQGITVAAEK
jgi:starvation-inducible outer membrane lipoprotein